MKRIISTQGIERLVPVAFTTCLLIALLFLFGCKRTNKNQAEDNIDGIGKIEVYNNPPAEGFDIEGSNPIAILLADKVMNSMGGREAWDNTQYISWNFFGRRHLLWDKKENKVRIDMDDLVIVVNTDDVTGQVWRDNELMQNEDSLAKYLKQGRDIWINDSYWLFMPFKLKDSGVTLAYIDEDSTKSGEPASLLRMTFDNVGNTPDNAYEIWITNEPRLVRQWAFYRKEFDEEPAFVLPWDNYQQYGDIMLSGDRGERKITDIKVWKKAPKDAFTSPAPLEKPES